MAAAKGAPVTGIEQASLAEAEAIALLSRHVHGLHVRRAPHIFEQPSTADLEAVFRELLARDDVRAFVAYAGATPVGYLLATIQERPASPLTLPRRWLYVDQISIEPRWARHGIGRQLVQSALDLARSLGIREVLADVWSFNDEAQEFFRACGFEPQMARFSLPLGD